MVYEQWLLVKEDGNAYSSPTNALYPLNFFSDAPSPSPDILDFSLSLGIHIHKPTDSRSTGTTDNEIKTNSRQPFSSLSSIDRLSIRIHPRKFSSRSVRANSRWKSSKRSSLLDLHPIVASVSNVLILTFAKREKRMFPRENAVNLSSIFLSIPRRVKRYEKIIQW